MPGQKKERTLTVNTVKTFAQTLRMMALSKELVENDDIATKREAYYVSKNWEDARFNEQPESDTVMDDVEAFFSVNREQLGFIPEEKGGDVAGRLVVLDQDRDTGKVLRIDCTKFGIGRLQHPDLGRAPAVRDQRQLHPGDRDGRHVPAPGQTQLLEEGQLHPDQHGRRADPGLPPLHPPARRLQEDPRLRLRRRRSLRHHQHLPHAQGRLRQRRPPQRVLLRAPGRASSASRRRTSSTTSCRPTRSRTSTSSAPATPSRTIPSSGTTSPGSQAMEQLLQMGVRAEQQALAKHGLNYVIDNYLPEKLRHPERFLP